jgi:hypothetical protein
MNVCVRPIERKRERIIEEHRKRDCGRKNEREKEKESGKEREREREIDRQTDRECI